MYVCPRELFTKCEPWCKLIKEPLGNRKLVNQFRLRHIHKSSLFSARHAAWLLYVAFSLQTHLTVLNNDMW